MKSRTKFLSIVLALILAISTFSVMSVAVSAAENIEDESTGLSLSTIDTPYESSIDHIEVVSLPEKNEFVEGVYFIGIDDSSFDGIEYNVYYTDGSIENFKYGEDNFSSLTDVRIFTLDGEEVPFMLTDEKGPYYNRLSIGEYTIKFYHRLKDYYPPEQIEIAEYKINVVEDVFLSSISSIEIIKKPDKVFSGPFISYNDWIGSEKEYSKYLLENYIPYNMNGAQLKINFNDGTFDVYNFNTPEGEYPVFFYKERLINVNDLGEYKAEVEFAGHTTVFEVNHTGAEPTNPDNSNTNLTDTSASQNQNANLSSADTAKSSTSDTATADTSIKGNADNGTIATGSVMCSFVAIIILVSASGVLVFFNRKRYSGKN